MPLQSADVAANSSSASNQLVVTLMRPSNKSLQIHTRRLRTPYIDNSVGRLRVHFHRIARIADIEYRLARDKKMLLHYENFSVL
jgi:hypothetical protein